MARLLPRRTPQTAQSADRRLTDPADASPPDRNPANHRTTTINSSIIVGWTLDIGWFLLPNTLRSKEAFILLFVGFGCHFGPPKTHCSFLTQSYQSYGKLQPSFLSTTPDNRTTANGCGDSVEKLVKATWRNSVGFAVVEGSASGRTTNCGGTPLGAGSFSMLRAA
jgi:hypothetical protein